jgi:hypothetical protein
VAIRPKKKPPATGRRGLEFAKTDSPLALFIVVAISQLQGTEHKSIHVAHRIPPALSGFKNQINQNQINLIEHTGISPPTEQW